MSRKPVDLSDNPKFGGPIGITPLGGCTQCKDCCFQYPDPEKARSNDYLKAICMIYTPERGMKPVGVMNDEAKCEYFDSLSQFLAEHPN